MKLYTERITRGRASNVFFYAGVEGFHHMGFEIVEMDSFDDIVISPDNVFFGGISFVQTALKKLNFNVPEHSDYPNSLSKFYGRKIIESTLSEVVGNPEPWNVFVKPKDKLKRFTGRLVKTTYDLIGCGGSETDAAVWLSEPVDFISEWRAFVRYDKIIGVKPYAGDWKCQYDHEIIEEAVNSYTNAPAGYAIDFGLTKDGRFLIVEVNEGYAIGNYGLYHIDYAKLISARWAQMTKQKDMCNF